MARPQRCRIICEKPAVTEFSPDEKKALEPVVLTLDEFEVIRLVDKEKQTHEQCAKQMGISRSTATEIYESARKKIADCLVSGYPLRIEGGNYRFCDGNSKWCSKRHCEKREDKIEGGERDENCNYRRSCRRSNCSSTNQTSG